MSFRQHAPEAKPISEFSFPKYDKLISGNNKLYLAPKRELGVLRLSLYWPLGSAHQPVKYLARSSNELRLRGTNSRSAEQILEGFEKLGASVDADNGLLHSSLSLKVQTSEYKNALQWLLENAEQASYPEKELNTYKQIEAAGLQRRMQTPRYWSQRLCMEALYGKNSPDSAFANPEDIASLSQDILLPWAGHNLNCASASLFISGDAGPKEIETTQALFAAAAQTGGGSIPAIPAVDYNGQNTVIKHTMEHANQVSMYWAKRIKRLTIKEMHTASLLNMFLGGFFGSRLMQELREERGLTYGIGSMLSLSTTGLTWYVSGEMNSVNAEEASNATAVIMDSLVSNPPAGDELDKAKRYYAGQLRGGFDGPFSLPSKLQFLQQSGYDESYYNQALDNIWAISTEDLCEMADNFLKPDSFTKALAGDVKY